MDEAAALTFRGVGTKPGLLIWCMQNSRLIPLPKSSYGNFCSGSCYIVLNTVARKIGFNQHDIHYWVGEDSSKLDAELASEKALELDAALGSCSVQFLELQGCETDKFLSYFRPCMIPAKGVFSSEEAVGVDNTSPKTRLFKCKGEHVIYVKEVPFCRSSLNHNHVFILDMETKLFIFCGSKTRIQQRTKALEVVQYMIDNKHVTRCEISNIDGGKFGDPDTVEFWSLFGGYAPLTREPCHDMVRGYRAVKQLFWLNKGKVVPCEAAPLERKILDRNRCYMLDCGADIFIWMGHNALVTERRMSVSAAEDFLRSQGRSASTHMTFLTEGFETAQFRAEFESWPRILESSLYEEGREKVAAIFKYQGYDVKEIPEESMHQVFVDSKGTLKVWLVDCGAIFLVPVSEQHKLYSEDCYVAQYTFLSSEKNYNLFYAWFGSASTMENREDALYHMGTMVDSIKGRAIMAQVVESKEPRQFLAIFRSIVIIKGGRSPGYSRMKLEAYDRDKTRLFRVQGTNPNYVKAIQVDLPLKQPISIREGAEPEAFWSAIGGKKEYPREKEKMSYIDGPHLFSCVLKEGTFKGEEIFNFCQADLNAEDILVLDNFTEIYVWVGQHALVTSKLEAFTIGKKFLEVDILMEGLSLETPIYAISEGSEPPFFTTFFDWDSTKTHTQGNSFERKLAILKGLAPRISVVTS